MCTCITFRANEFYFGRNLDLDVSFGEKVAVTPRNYPFHFRYLPDLSEHYAMIGMANVTKNYPLYAEAANEKGVCIAGLNFPGNACYQDFKHGKINIASYELIPWLLGKSKSADEAAQMLREYHRRCIYRTDAACPPALDAGRSSQLLCGGGGGRRGKNLSQSYWRSDQQSTVSFSPGLYPEFSAFVTGNARKPFCKEAGKRRSSGKMEAYSLWGGNGSYRASRRCFVGFPVREGFFPEVELRVRRRCRGGNLSVFSYPGRCQYGAGIRTDGGGKI